MSLAKGEVRGSLSRRSFLQASALAGAAALAESIPLFAQKADSPSTTAKVNGRRKLGTLEVSSVGLGCQDFTGTFYATAPNRADVIVLARTAHERGVTLFDAAEAYGPLEVERILGEALAPVRKEVVYSSKFGWNIDPETGQNLGGLIAALSTSAFPSRACSNAGAPIAWISYTSIVSIPTFQSRM
jgi:Aldo/keto reductase family/TAT (twin-arginine translocation) pathway signal sequence